MREWRNSYLKPRFLKLDGRLFVVLLMTALHIRLWTLEAFAALSIFLAIIEMWKGITLEVFFRMIRSKIAGKHRPAHRKTKMRRAIDYGEFENEYVRRKLGLEIDV